MEATVKAHGKSARNGFPHAGGKKHRRLPGRPIKGQEEIDQRVDWIEYENILRLQGMNAEADEFHAKHFKY